MRIESFAPSHVDEAATLLAERHARHRAAEPLLPAAYEAPTAARTEIERLLAAGAEGVAATRDGRVVAFLLGTRSSDAVWGPNVWVEPAAHAATRAEDLRDAYAAAAVSWVDAGRRAHYALVPASDAALVDAWFRLGFGQQQAYGIRQLGGSGSLPPGVRVAERRDIDALVTLAPLISHHHGRSPVFSAGPGASRTEDEHRTDIEEDFDDPDLGNLVAEVDGRIVGNFVVVPAAASSMHAGLARPDGAAYLGWAATLPEVRGSGAGVALTEGAFAWARARGYETMVTDWRVTNLLSSRFWPARGFRPTFLRLHRLLA